MWNKISALMILVTAASLLIIPIEVDARGGRGGGGGGRDSGGGRSSSAGRGGGAYRGGNTMNRTPSMSRSSSRPSGSQLRQRPQNRPSQSLPSVSQGRVQQARQGSQQRPSTANRAELRSQVSQYAKSRPSEKFDRKSLSQKGQDFSHRRGNQIAQNRQYSDRVSDRLRHSWPDSNRWFDRNFFDRHHIDVGYVGVGANWWRPAAWATLANWGAWQWQTPYYYDDGGDVYPLTSADYTSYPSSMTTTVVQPIQTQAVQSNQPAAVDDWLPLGVFAVAGNADVAAQTSFFIQLAINRSGEIDGVLYNSTTDVAQDLTGMVDPNTQKAYWSLDNKVDSPIASTGIYNLTEDQTPINVRFADGSEQTWVLVRLKQGQ